MTLRQLTLMLIPPRYIRNILILLIICATAWIVSAQTRSVDSILTCYSGDGSVIIQAPSPSPENFRVQINAGGVTHAEWTLPTKQKQILVTTMPCLYFVTQDVPGSIGADNQ